MTIIIPLPSILAGLAAGGLYIALHHGWIVGLTAPFLPLFVLAFSGMRYGRAGISVACFAALPLILFTLPFHDAVWILMGQLVPLILFIRGLMVATMLREPPIIFWAPIGVAIASLAAYGAALFLLLITMQNGLYTHITATMQATIAASFTSLEPEAAAMMEGLAKRIPHLLVAIDFWIWSVLLFVVVKLANGAVHSLGHGHRPPLQLLAHSPPNWMLAVFGITLVLAFIAPSSLQQGAQAASIILLLPYFFSGLSAVHSRLHALPNSGVWMVGFYLLFILLSLWPVVLVTLFALGHHVKRYALISIHASKDTK